jgi:uncharacterized membrane protein
VAIDARNAVPLAALGALTGAFFIARRFRPVRGIPGVALRSVVSLPLVLSGTLHVLRPAMFVALLPPPFPRQAWLIVLTGLPELLGAAGLWLPRTRKTASVCLAVFLIAIFPANIYVAGQTVAGLPMPRIPTRLAMQAAYILLVLIAGWGVPFLGMHKPSAADPHP